MISVTIKGIEEAEERLKRAGADADRATRAAVFDASLDASRRLKARFLPRAGYHQLWGPVSPSGSFLGVRSGQSRQRITPGGDVIERRVGDAVEYRAEVGSPDRHVAFHEEGGTIHGNPFLRIPTVHAQTPTGQDRFTGQSIRDIPGTFLARSKTGKLWAMQRGNQARSGRARGTDAVPLFLLVRSVTHRPRGTFAAVAREMEPSLQKGLEAQVSRVTGAANG